MMQFFFFAFSALILLGGHALTYFLIVRLFGVESFSWRLGIIIAIIFLFLSVLVSSFLIHKLDNLFTRSYYIFSGVWIGILLNLGVTAVFVLLLRPILGAFDLSLSPIYFKLIFLSGILLLSGLGLYRAFNPAITFYEVYIKDLPEYWDNKVVAHISDVHLGPVYREKFLHKIIDKTNSFKPEAVFITGDFFDGMEGDFSWLKRPLEKFKTPSGIYYGFGNHDLYLGFNKAVELLKDESLVILDNKLVEVEGLQIIGISYSFSVDDDLESSILKQEAYDREKASILLFHVPQNIPLAKSAGIDLQLSGHTHDGQMFPFNFPAKWAHKGYGYGLFKEGDFSLIVNGGAGTWGPPFRTTSRAEIVKITLKKK